ncbi:MAG: hypothetical protein HUJ68_03335, partial [Clostridia bacterium]|nr:hypothetical protein [Clostridia bacterium]
QIYSCNYYRRKKGAIKHPLCKYYFLPLTFFALARFAFASKLSTFSSFLVTQPFSAALALFWCSKSSRSAAFSVVKIALILSFLLFVFVLLALARFAFASKLSTSSSFLETQPFSAERDFFK